MTVNASEIAAFLGKPLLGPDRPVTRVAAVADPDLSDALVFAQAELNEAQLLRIDSAGLALLSTSSVPPSCSHVVVANPRLAFAKVVGRFFATPRITGVDRSATISGETIIGQGVTIGANVVIVGRVVIGDESVIHPNVVIYGPTHIGARCVIKSGSVIGQEGFGVAFEDDGTPVRVPQIGGVEIEDDVELGALNTVASGTISPTVVRRGTKCDDHVHIAHNCDIGPEAILTACVELSGSVKVGARVWLGPNASVMNKISIGANSIIGLGAVVTKSIDDGSVAVGNPHRVIRKVGGKANVST